MKTQGMKIDKFRMNDYYRHYIFQLQTPQLTLSDL